MADYVADELDDEFSLVNEELVTLFAPDSEVTELACFAHEVAMCVIDQDLESVQYCLCDFSELIEKHGLKPDNAERLQWT